MNILYIHGFGSSFQPSNSKIKLLENLGTVFGTNIDYTKSRHLVAAELIYFAIKKKIDLVVGTSLGGYYAIEIAEELGVPFVALNPAIAPGDTLQKYIGAGTGWNGIDFTLAKTIVAEYTPVTLDATGLILLDKDDDVIDAAYTMRTLRDDYQIVEFDGGSHRFEHMAEALPIIKTMYQLAQLSLGFNVG